MTAPSKRLIQYLPFVHVQNTSTFPDAHVASVMSCQVLEDGARLWTCVLCAKSCNRKANLREHILAVHMSSEVACPYADCGTLCRSGPALRMHLKRKHDANKPF
jgi:uncharacterized Zn-finger protein